MTLGSNITYYRKKLALTQEALAQEFGVTNQAVSKWESDQSCPDILLLPRLADFFGISMEALFGRETGKTEPVCADVSWPDDDVLRVVVYEGKRIICGGAAAKDFNLEYRKNVKEILSAVTVTCGDVKGNVYSNLCVNCAEVGGDVDAGTAVNCGNVGGGVDAGTSVRCGSVSGDIDAGGKVQIG